MKSPNIVSQDRKNPFAALYPERSTRQKIILNVCDEQRIMGCQGDLRSHCNVEESADLLIF